MINAPKAPTPTPAPAIKGLAKQPTNQEQATKQAQEEVQYNAIRDLTIKPSIREGKVNFNKFLYKGTNITTNLPDPKIVTTLASKLANNIKASNADPPAASTSISIQIKAPAAKGAKRAASKYSIYSNFGSNNKE